jgi:hypothetical protein
MTALNPAPGVAMKARLGGKPVNVATCTRCGTVSAWFGRLDEGGGKTREGFVCKGCLKE